MNKFGVISLSVLGTLGVSVGAVAILNNLPATKGKLNISYGDNQILGNLKPVNPGNTSQDGTSFEDGLSERKYIEVGYKNGDDITFCLQRSGSVVNYAEVALEDKNGNILIGFVNEAGETVLFPKNGDILTPVYVAEDTFVNYVNYVDMFETTTGSYGGLVSNLEIFKVPVSNWGLHIRILGLSSSADEIVPITEIKDNEDCYLIYYLEEANVICPLSNLSIEVNKYVYGENCFLTSHFVGIEGTKECVLKDCRKDFVYFTTSDISGTAYSVLGFATSPDSVEMIDIKDMSPDLTYYAVYAGGMAGDILCSLNQMKEYGNVIVCRRDDNYLLSYSNLSTYSAGTLTIQNVQFDFYGFAVSSTSNEKIADENLTQEYLEANNITSLYCLYSNMAGEVYNVSELNVRASRVYYKDSNNKERSATNVVFLSSYEADVTINGVTYTFVGWSLARGSTEIVENFTSSDYLYAVYLDPTSGELISYMNIR